MKTEQLGRDDDEEESVNKRRIRNDLFTRFAYSPASSSSKEIKPKASQSMGSETQELGSKRKVTSNEENVDRTGVSIAEQGAQILTEGVSSPKKARTTASSKVKYYHHLKALDDCLANGLDVVFCGINAGQRSSEIGHHYGNPTNHFWSCVYESGLTPRKLEPKDDVLMPSKYGIGLTNLCHRPSVEQNEIAREEFEQGVPILLEKLVTYKPKILCFVGLGIADIFKAVVVKNRVEGTKIAKGKAAVGLQPYKMVHTNCDGSHSETIFYAVSSTSGRVVRYQKTEKVEQFKGIFEVLTKIKDDRLDSSGLPVFGPNATNKAVAVRTMDGHCKMQGAIV